MPISFADLHRIPADVFANTGCFDPILDIDTRLFIDPRLLRDSQAPELGKSHERLVTRFQKIFKLLAECRHEGDPFWNAAAKAFDFPEVSGLCIGYASDGIGGSGMGAGLRDAVLRTAKIVVDAGRKDPEFFELLGVFQEDIGPDRISDMVARIIVDDLVAYTQRICREFGLPLEHHSVGNRTFELPTNPIKGGPVLLVPRDVLRNLPIAMSWSDIDVICEHNEELRQAVNEIIGDTWRKATHSVAKEAVRNALIDNPELLDDLIERYRSKPSETYDYADDPAGEVTWYRVSRQVANTYQLALHLSANPTQDDVKRVVLEICDHFRRLIENNQLAKLLYDKNGARKPESAAQLLFFGIADAYCKANDLDLSPEADAGRGPVDFKMSRGYNSRVLVETKLTSNQRLVHGYEKQLEAYKAAEGTTAAIYLVIDNGGATEQRIQKFQEIVVANGDNGPTVIWVDATVLPSASKAD